MLFCPFSTRSAAFSTPPTPQQYHESLPVCRFLSVPRYLRENHNSVLGIREYAMMNGAAFQVQVVSVALVCYAV
jgi:hypothetical protein